MTNRETKQMFDRNTAWLEDKIFPALREKAGLPQADKKELVQLCNYIDWSLRSGIKLNFTLTEEELKYVEICIESQIYTDLGIYPE